MVDSGLSLSELKKPVKKIPQILLNVPVSGEFSLGKFPKIHSELNRISGTLGKSGRVLLRESGTEPVVRIMVEGPDKQDITSLANDLARLVEATKD
jgi:phosphoglucosamine mutase